MPKAKQVGKMLVSSDDTPRKMRVNMNEPDAPGVMLTVARLVPDAREALPEDEYEARIAEYQRRVEQNLPLPLFGCEQPQVPDRVCHKTRETQCWACGLIASRSGHIDYKCSPVPRKLSETPDAVRKREAIAASSAIARRDRWRSRDIHICGMWHTTEIYCAKCFSTWGWPDELAAIIECLEGIAQIYADYTGEGVGMDGDCGGSERKPAAARARSGASRRASALAV